MNSTIVNGELLQLRSATRGRQRWQVDALRRKPFLAHALTNALGKEPSIKQAQANHLTGRVLVLFDEHNPPPPLADLIAIKLSEILEEPLVEKATPTTPPLKLTGDERRQLKALIESVEGQSKLHREAVLASAVNTTFKITTPLTQGLIMACVIQGGFPLLTRLGLSVLQQLGFLSVGYFTSAALEKSSEHRRKHKWRAYASKVENELRLRAYRHIHALPMATLAERGWKTTDLQKFVKDDTRKVRDFIEQSAPNFIDKGITFTVCGSLMVLISPITLVLALVPLPFIYRLTRKYNQEIAEDLATEDLHERALDSRINNTLNGMATVRSYTAEVSEQEVLAKLDRQSQQSHDRVVSRSSKYHASVDFGIYSGITLPIIYSSYQVYQGQLNFTAYTSLCFLLPLLVFSTQGLDRDSAMYLAARRAGSRLTDLLATPLPEPQPTVLVPEQVQGEIRFEEVSFAYPQPAGIDPWRGEPPPVLKQVSLAIPPGSTVAFVGTSGSGKSTLVKLLMRFFEPDSGRILLDGQDVREMNPVQLRQALSWVSQEVYLFEGSIADNIGYGSVLAETQDIEEVAELVTADGFIQAREGGYGARVGERGKLLSGGQRQRIAVARALLKQAPVLILDEATSAVDNLTESRIHQAIMETHRGHTVIVVAHRLSTVCKADMIYLLEDGQVIEAGNHDDLLAQNGSYARLWALQVDQGS